WYVDALTGAVGPIRLRRPPSPPPRGGADRHRRRTASATNMAGDPVIIGRLQRIDALTVAFDYAGAVATTDDERQFLRVDGAGGPDFIRRDPAAEAAALEALRQDGFVQMRVADKAAAKGRRVFVFRGRDA